MPREAQADIDRVDQANDPARKTGIAPRIAANAAIGTPSPGAEMRPSVAYEPGTTARSASRQAAFRNRQFQMGPVDEE
jgi:hypothetical protein